MAASRVRVAWVASSSSSDEEMPIAQRRRRELSELRSALSRGEANLLAATRGAASAKVELQAMQARHRTEQAQLKLLRDELEEVESTAAIANTEAAHHAYAAAAAMSERDQIRQAAAEADCRARDVLLSFRSRLVNVETRVAEERAEREGELLRMDSLVRQLVAQVSLSLFIPLSPEICSHI